jgi:uncharacterized Zn-binding protein involved in type VI secretion
MKKNQIQSILSLIMFFTIFILLWVIPKEASPAQQAARLGDTTAHGGVIVAGCSTVLIGGMPAARVGDMHTCPMTNPGVPPSPHIGGPIIMGSPTVLIGGMPAARVGDMAICSGPPDTIALGCPTVLIGVGGAGQPKKYSEDYIRSKYNRSVVITEKEFERTKIKKKR